MGILSLLPEPLSTIETWVARVFLGLAIITIFPWIAVLVYDVVLYIFRSVTYEIPVVGGRARGKMRPRAPSLTERPSGHRRKFSLRRHEDSAHTTGGLQSDSDSQDTRWRHIKEENVQDPWMPGE